MSRLRHKRDKKRNKIKDKYIKDNPKCERCGQQGDTVHHRIPVHVSKDLELDEDNLMTLCDNRTRKCHFIYGHMCNWRKWNTGLADINKLIKNL